MPSKPAIPFPSHLRLLTPAGLGYGSAVAAGDKTVTVDHLGARPGVRIQFGVFIRTVTAVHRITVDGLTTGGGQTGNRGGDLAVLETDLPWPREVTRAWISARPAAGKAWVTHADGIRSPRLVLPKAERFRRARGQGKAGLPPDYLDERWLVLDLPSARTRPLVGGDSGGGIFNKKGELVSLVSRIDGGMGPNLTHPDFRKILAAHGL